jgi:hypothetical protein
MALAIAAALVAPAFAKGHAGPKAAKAPKTQKAPAAKKASAIDFSAIRVDHI